MNGSKTNKGTGVGVYRLGLRRGHQLTGPEPQLGISAEVASEGNWARVGNMSIVTPFMDKGGLGTFFRHHQLKQLKDL